MRDSSRLESSTNLRTSERVYESRWRKSIRERERGRNTYGFLRYINSDLIIILIDVELRTNERKVSTMSNSFEEDLARKTGLTHIRNELIRSQFLTIWFELRIEIADLEVWRFDRKWRKRGGEEERGQNNVNTLSLSLKCIERESRLTDHEPDFWEIFTSSLTVSVHHFFQPRSLFDFDDQFWETTTLDLPIHSFISIRVMEWVERGESCVLWGKHGRQIVLLV